jgi:hypothetical protein
MKPKRRVCTSGCCHWLPSPCQSVASECRLRPGSDPYVHSGDKCRADGNPLCLPECARGGVQREAEA